MSVAVALIGASRIGSTQPLPSALPPPSSEPMPPAPSVAAVPAATPSDTALPAPAASSAAPTAQVPAPVTAPSGGSDQPPAQGKGLAPHGKAIQSEKLFRVGAAVMAASGATLLLGMYLDVSASSPICVYGCSADEDKRKVGKALMAVGYPLLLAGSGLLAIGQAADPARSRTLVVVGASVAALGLGIVPLSLLGMEGDFERDYQRRGIEAWAGGLVAGIALAVGGTAAFAYGAQRASAPDPAAASPPKKTSRFTIHPSFGLLGVEGHW